MTYVAEIEVWFTPMGSHWVVQEKDAEGNQIGEATYLAHKADAKDVALELRVVAASRQGNAPSLKIGTRVSG